MNSHISKIKLVEKAGVSLSGQWWRCNLNCSHSEYVTSVRKPMYKTLVCPRCTEIGRKTK